MGRTSSPEKNKKKEIISIFPLDVVSLPEMLKSPYFQNEGKTSAKTLTAEKSKDPGVSITYIKPLNHPTWGTTYCGAPDNWDNELFLT